MKKTMLAVVFLALTFMAVMLGGCGEVEEKMPEVADEAQMKKDIQGFTIFDSCTKACENLWAIDSEAQNWKLISLELDKRKTDVENGQDVAYCNVIIEGREIAFSRYMRLTYNYYDVGGWVLDQVHTENESNFAIAKMNDDYISIDSFPGSIMASWENYTLVKHDFSIENQTDCISYVVSLNLPFYEMSGKFKLNYSYSPEVGWIYDSMDDSGIEARWKLSGLWKAELDGGITELLLLDMEQVDGRGAEYRGGNLVCEGELTELYFDPISYDISWKWEDQMGIDMAYDGIWGAYNHFYNFSGWLSFSGMNGELNSSQVFDINWSGICHPTFVKIATLEEVKKAGIADWTVYPENIM